MSMPVVIVTAPIRLDEGHPRVRLMRAYLSAVERAGLLPFISAPPHDVLTTPASAAEVLAHAQGLLLTGGEDVDPTRYHATPHPALAEVSQERDAWEIALANEARQRQMPTLAICRGIQLANVAFGGTLIQDLPSERGGTIDHAPGGPRNTRSHGLTVVAESRAGHALGATELQVNSIHHQAVDRVAPGFLATAHAPDGVIEAIEPEDPVWWFLGVQWHPEELESSDTKDRGVFSAFSDVMSTWR